MSVVIPSKRIIIGVRLAPSLWKSFEEAVANTDDPTVMLVQAQAHPWIQCQNHPLPEARVG